MSSTSMKSNSLEHEAQDKSIPGTQVLDWRARTPRPRLRRPMTACQACRSAKAKCNGQSKCQRCKKRGISCEFNPISNEGNGSINGDHYDRRRNSVTPSLLTDDVPAGQIPESRCIPRHDTITNQQSPQYDSTFNGVENWNERALNDALEQFDWIFPEPQITLDNDLGHFDPVNNDINNDKTPPSIPALPDLSQEIQLPSISCECRANMMIHVPKLESAIRQQPKPQLDTMFKLTGEIIQSCQKSTDCDCFKGPVDLVCIMTTFEQTAVCFDYIAKSGFDGTVKVGIGNYCISKTDDASFKRILVLDLVGQADHLLDSLTSLAFDMESKHQPGAKAMGRSPNCLNKLNMNYLHEAVASFKKLFEIIHGFFDGNK
ncbi:hypothetical protein N7478_007491 [Penicillium angulare]|uniref:uncharacterized protein n=1 Tax=Penicillium angulare TaxID=116970 RepID=UPI0025409F59|nr:uncharacterized protein N7478_007491 [Penicillium angulare]KAJ5272366.1 hypothetical protein N7478_007491 [Penicillium angulare]